MNPRGVIVAISVALAGCAATPKPQPHVAPRVDCSQGSTAAVPEFPLVFSKDGFAFSVAVLYILAEERRLRALEHKCIEELKQKGIIR